MRSCEGARRLRLHRFMRLPYASVLVIASLIGCATPRASKQQVVRRAAEHAALQPAHHLPAVALFVRDETDSSVRLAALLRDELQSAGVRSVLCLARAEPLPPWATDQVTAVDTHLPYAVRVTVVTRRDQRAELHRPVAGSQPSTGFGIGPSIDPAPSSFPELGEVGDREAIDVGPTLVLQDLRLDVMVSLRKTDGAELITRWTTTEGELRVDRPASSRRDRWSDLYEVTAHRVATGIAGSIDSR